MTVRGVATSPNWQRIRTDARLRQNLEIRQRVYQGIRDFFAARDFLEVDVPVLIPLPGMEPHLHPIAATIHDRRGRAYRFYLHTSPEYSLKKLLAGGLERIYAITHAFRDYEVSETHNVEFALLEWYRAGADYRDLMQDCEELLVYLAERLCGSRVLRYRGREIDLAPPWPRVTVRQVMRQFAGVEVSGSTSLSELVEIARAKGYNEVQPDWPWEDVFYLLFLNEVEPHFPLDRPLILYDYPAPMAALARRREEDPFTAERFELYIGGLELANAFSELTDPVEQRARLVQERQERIRLRRHVYPVDESFLEALEIGLPPSAGIALGVDRLVMLFADAAEVREVIPFPTRDLIRDWRKSHKLPSGSE
ncbi:MAG: EF-P lysine aminoacylase EpmA [candidate division KSB1 bacterium]|nr:EF-P lysine aminoacylase EpmA [candidate division KSB1 bacterium]